MKQKLLLRAEFFFLITPSVLLNGTYISKGVDELALGAGPSLGEAVLLEKHDSGHRKRKCSHHLFQGN